VRTGKILEHIHGVDAHEERREIELAALTPTQGTVYADELEGRRYELERGLAEPLVVVQTPDSLLLADGHHRSKAAKQLDIARMDAYVIVIEEPVELGMAETARQEELSDIEDIDAVDYAHHPLVETTERLQDRG
jgi:IMP dehydrogenase